jgi:hypothetical protein
MAESDKKQGANDAQRGNGPKAPNDFASSQAREDYYAAYNQNKKKELGAGAEGWKPRPPHSFRA